MKASPQPLRSAVGVHVATEPRYPRKRPRWGKRTNGTEKLEIVTGRSGQESPPGRDHVSEKSGGEGPGVNSRSERVSAGHAWAGIRPAGFSPPEGNTAKHAKTECPACGPGGAGCGPPRNGNTRDTRRQCTPASGDQGRRLHQGALLVETVGKRRNPAGPGNSSPLQTAEGKAEQANGKEQARRRRPTRGPSRGATRRGRMQARHGTDQGSGGHGRQANRATPGPRRVSDGAGRR